MLTIGKAAKRTCLSISAIRYYERQGLVRPSRLLNGYRLYDEAEVSALNFVRRAQGFGITLREIRQVLELSRDGRRPCECVRDVARQHLAEIDTKIRQLQFLRVELRNLLERRIAFNSKQMCPLIQADPN
ncbi:MAG: MerR family DNA-binding protein [Candidatus Binataceae bacterium]